MASNTISVRFSIQDQEAVKKALEALGKDGQAALNKLNAAGKDVGTGFKPLTNVIDEVRGRAQGFVSSAGLLGMALTGLGPVGLAAAAVIGGLVYVFHEAGESAKEFGDKAGRLRDAAEATGLTISQFKALSAAGAQIGLDSEQTEKIIVKLTASFDEARRGGGQLFEQLARINPELALELSAAKDTAGAIGVLARAYENVSDTAQRNALDKAIGGRGGAGMVGRLFGEITNKGGLSGITAAAEAAGKAIDEGMVTRVDELKKQLDATQKRIDFMKDSFYAEAMLERQLRVLRVEEQLLSTLTKSAEATNEAAAAEEARAKAAERLGGASFRRNASARTSDEVSDARSRLASGLSAGDRFDLEGALTDNWARDLVAVPVKPNPPARTPTAAAQLSAMQRWTSVLGQALTPTEQLTQRTLELNAAQDDKKINYDQKVRALNAFKLAQAQVALGIRERLGVAREEEIVAVKLRDLDDLAAKGYIDNSEKIRAAALIRKEAKDATDAQTIRLSDTPSLTRLTLESQNFTKLLDTEMSSAVRGMTSDLLAMEKGTMSVGAGLKSMTAKMMDAISQAILMKTVIGPVAGGISSVIGSLFGVSVKSSYGNVFSGGNIIPFSLGGVVSQPSIFRLANGGLASMAERETEAIMPLRRTASGRLGVEVAGGGGGIHVSMPVTIDARGADRGVETRLRSAMTEYQKTLPATVVAVMADARSRRMAG